MLSNDDEPSRGPLIQAVVACGNLVSFFGSQEGDLAR
jgi:hypothetical protein